MSETTPDVSVATTDSGATPDPGATPADNGGEIGEAGKRALADLRREVRAIAKDRDEWKSRAESSESATQSDSERRDAELATTRSEFALLKSEADQQKLDHMRRDAADDADLPKGWWKRLTGETADELAADAKQLADDLGGQRPAPDLGAGARPGGPATGQSGMSQRIRDRAKR